MRKILVVDATQCLRPDKEQCSKFDTALRLYSGANEQAPRAAMPL